jgi:hypothetical protein
MHPDQIGGFLDAISAVNEDSWAEEVVNKLACLDVPREILGERHLLLKADIIVLQAGWFIESFVDLASYEYNLSTNISHLATEIRAILRLQLPTMPSDELNRIVHDVSRLAWERVKARRDRHRKSIGLDDKRQLWAEAQPDPRCYLCGYRFTDEAAAQFLKEGDDPILLPPLVDFVRPRGIKERHVSIEVDHYRAVEAGGPTTLGNLKLACGWCNIVKSKYTSLYDVGSWPKAQFEHPAFGWTTIPRPFWVLRTVKLRARCDYAPGECEARIDTHELFAAPRNGQGVLNPVNIAVYCANHDPWNVERYVDPALLSSR